MDVGEVADELALDFDDGYLLLPQFLELRWLSAAVQPAAGEVRRLLDEMSGPGSPWSFEDLRRDVRWSEVRAAAIETLGNINRGTYIQ